MKRTLITALFLLLPQTSFAASLIADLSTRLIEIGPEFNGAQITVFGAIEGPADIVIIVRGPKEKMIMSRKERIGGIWATAETATFINAPGYYYAASTEDFDNLPLQPFSGSDYKDLTLKEDLPELSAHAFRQSLVSRQEERQLYNEEPNTIRVLDNRLFHSEITLPATAPPGVYTVAVHLIQNGKITKTATTGFSVRRTGFSARIYGFANHHSTLYALTVTFLAISLGGLTGRFWR